VKKFRAVMVVLVVLTASGAASADDAITRPPAVPASLKDRAAREALCEVVPCTFLELDVPESSRLTATLQGTTEAVTVCEGPCGVRVPLEPYATYAVTSAGGAAALRVEWSASGKSCVRVAFHPANQGLLIGGALTAVSTSLAQTGHCIERT
jgi:hypothetical protein